MQNKEKFNYDILDKVANSGKRVPEILLSGHHANIEKWRREQSILRTFKKRPELLERAALSEKDQEFLRELMQNKA